MSGKQILVLGSGMVARPCVEYLIRDTENNVTVACRTLSAAQALVSGLARTRAISLDVSSFADLDRQVAAHDLVISLVPYIYHAAVIKSAIKGKTNVVTTSYVSPAMRELDGAVKEAGIVVLNEVGLDPGIDHLYAIKTIDEIHAKCGMVKQFYSYCGGLPAPECANNPLGFKFSWSPRGALLAQRNSASYLSEGKQVDISAQDLMSASKPYFVNDRYSFVAYPNRNSVPFREFYNIPEAETVIRGSLRYEGNPEFIQALVDLGWLDAEEKHWLNAELTWAQIQQKAIGAEDSTTGTLISRIKEICKFSSEAECDRIVSGLEWMGLLSSERATVRGGNLLDTLCGQLENLLNYQPGERDLVMLQHKFVVEWRDGKTDTLTSTLELLGDPKGYSAMAFSVGITCGIASQLLLDGCSALSTPGVLAPYTKEMCDPIREIVEREGIKLVENVL
ncbi:Saccharopine dehydrogenase [Lipomyces tetrasporus]|uniref:Saccharopine dehydrogenase n=1 Tax=Lipomyces tetrasporus TaxID=54092 RepID=A0AAD7QWH3_9ASCO|nr:Saccharopine dehydrogenase [Lipomyces tetrasporus]KAJ8102807.1 Saccharopine dehydrogenase [Lipomyces tetrasporus]